MKLFNISVQCIKYYDWEFLVSEIQLEKANGLHAEIAVNSIQNSYVSLTLIFNEICFIYATVHCKTPLINWKAKLRPNFYARRIDKEMKNKDNRNK